MTFGQAWVLLCGLKDKPSYDAMVEIAQNVEKNGTNVMHELHAYRVRNKETRKACSCSACGG